MELQPECLCNRHTEELVRMSKVDEEYMYCLPESVPEHCLWLLSYYICQAVVALCIIPFPRQHKFVGLYENLVVLYQNVVGLYEK